MAPALLLGLLASCHTPMTIEEAEQVAVAMHGRSLVPPQRRINDVLAFLEQDGRGPLSADPAASSVLAQSPPGPADIQGLVNHYKHRGEVLMQAGRYNQALADLRTAQAYDGRTAQTDPELLFKLGYAEFVCGNYRDALANFHESNAITPRLRTYDALVKLYARVGDLRNAEEAERRGSRRCTSLRVPERWRPWCRFYTAKMKAYLLEARGRFNEAEPYHRSALNSIRQVAKNPWPILVQKIYLTRNLRHQERWLEAELAARHALQEVVQVTGRRSEIFGTAVGDLGEVLMLQGRLEEAHLVLQAALSIMEEVRIDEGAYLMADERMRFGNVLALRENYPAAMAQFDLVESGVRDDPYLYRYLLARNPTLILSLIKTDRVGEAMALIDLFFQRDSDVFGPSHHLTREMMGLRAMAYAIQGRDDRALKDFAACVPFLLDDERREETAVDRKLRARIIIEAYIDLLVRIHGSGLADRLSIDALGRAFELADALSSPVVRGAVGAHMARAAVIAPDLAELVRREQDTRKQLEVSERMLSDHLAAPANQQLPGMVKASRAEIESLADACRTLREEIQRRFPQYADLTHPRPVGIDQVRQYLDPTEVFLSVFVSERNTYVWAIPKSGATGFFQAPIGEKELQRQVADLRRALDPDPEVLGDIPPFDIETAHGLYDLLLGPVEEHWADAAQLLVSAHGPLGQLPFGVLVTSPTILEGNREMLFEGYRRVPWLIRRVALTRLPSAAALVSFRTAPPGYPARKAFVGFGDPLFNVAQMTAEAAEKPASGSASGRDQRILVRGIRKTDEGSLDNPAMGSSRLTALHRLPDTADEVSSIAAILGADPQTDVFLGRRASEERVKTMDLANRKVVVFATHALLPGDLDGLTQPALALCAPEVTGGQEDGLFTMGEIMTLQMNADWVLLSACNTGAAEGRGLEAVSGLGRAFFYAGTRTLLVSMWPVETSSARRLTTGLFKHLHPPSPRTRATALKAAMEDVIDRAYLADPASGGHVASCAHPLFWAPFILVGENGVGLEKGL